MVVDWPVTGGGGLAWVSAEVTSSGTVNLQLGRVSGSTVLRLIGAADGALSQAVFESTPLKCTLAASSLAAGRYAYLVNQYDSFINGGALAGSESDLVPSALVHFSDGLTHEVVTGAPGVLDSTTMRLYSWGGASNFQKIPADIGLAVTEATFVGDALFWSASSIPRTKIKVWTQAVGSADLISFGSDTSQGASDLGSDGHDLVWLYGSGRMNPSGTFPTVSIMTAPFVTDPSKLSARRLRSEGPAGFGTSQFAVGCGYAANQAQSGSDFGVRVVRLADGVSWFLSGDSGLPWRWTAPLALTCTELFAKVLVQGSDGGPLEPTLARVRLDSLGPGTPPD